MCGAEPPRRAPAIFDLDGTLIATRRLYLEAFADALEPVLGHRPDHDEMMALRPRAEVRFLLQVGGSEAHPGVMDRFYEAYARRHAQDFEGIYPGVLDLLAALRTARVPLGLVTGKSRRSWDITRRHLPPELSTFDAAVFDDDVPAPKPDPAGLHQALAALVPESVPDSVPDPVPDPDRRPGAVGGIYVGDTRSDLEAAHAAGLTPVAVLWSRRPSERRAFTDLAGELGGVALSTPEELGRWILRPRPRG